MNVAVAGLGFMGATHVKAWKNMAGVRLAAVVSSDETKLSGDLTSIEGNLGLQGERFDFSEVSQYRSLQDALRNPEIDAVDLCLPTYLHEAAAMEALSAGKHVLLEKPMALDFAGAERIRRCAEDNGKILMVGQVLRFIPAYQSAARWLGNAGTVRHAMFRRRCASPPWSGWLSDKSRSGGGVFDFLIHDADFCISLWGMPDAVRARGYEDLAAGIDVIHAELLYKNLGPVIVSGGWLPPASYPFSMDYAIVAEKDSLEWSSLQDTGTSDPFAAELAYFAECVRDHRQPDLCPPQQSAQAVALMGFMLESREHNGENVPTA